MARLLLIQDVFLLAHDDESGKNKASLALQGAMSGALLLDLAAAGLITIEDDRVHATAAKTTDPLLARAARIVADEPDPKKPSHWLNALPRALKPFDRTVGESLVERGVLAQEKAKVLGLFPTTRWPERDPAPEQQLRAELGDALLGRAQPSVRVLLLAALLDRYAMVDGLVDQPDRKQARQQAKAFAEQAEQSDAISAAVGESVRAAQAAALTAVLTSTIATTVITTSN